MKDYLLTHGEEGPITTDLLEPGWYTCLSRYTLWAVRIVRLANAGGLEWDRGGVVRYGLGFVRLGQAVCQGVWEYNLVV